MKPPQKKDYQYPKDPIHIAKINYHNQAISDYHTYIDQELERLLHIQPIKGMTPYQTILLEIQAIRTLLKGGEDG